jgi:single-strand DNA-binding protein
MAKEGLNKVQLIGFLGKDPELRHTQGNQPVMSMRVATTEKFPNRDNEWQERTEWHNVVVWGKRAEGLAKFLKKGAMVYVEGRIQTRSYEDKQGQKRYATDIVARNVLPLDRRGGPGGEGAPPPPTDDDYLGGGSDAGGGPSDFGDDEVPF